MGSRHAFVCNICKYISYVPKVNFTELTCRNCDKCGPVDGGARYVKEWEDETYDICYGMSRQEFICIGTHRDLVFISFLDF